jgi:hypothetical protein
LTVQIAGHKILLLKVQKSSRLAAQHHNNNKYAQKKKLMPVKEGNFIVIPVSV